MSSSSKHIHNDFKRKRMYSSWSVADRNRLGGKASMREFVQEESVVVQSAQNYNSELELWPDPLKRSCWKAGQRRRGGGGWRNPIRRSEREREEFLLHLHKGRKSPYYSGEKKERKKKLHSTQNSLTWTQMIRVPQRLGCDAKSTLWGNTVQLKESCLIQAFV